MSALLALPVLGSNPFSTNVLALWAKHPKTFATLKEPSFANSVVVRVT